MASNNDVGLAGRLGFGVGIAPVVPRGFSEFAGTRDVQSPEYGNYLYADGSVMVWVPAFLFRVGGNGSAAQKHLVTIKPPSDFIDGEDIRRTGFSWHRAFFNAGQLQPGFFVDKYLCSNRNGIASSIASAVPLSSAKRGRLSGADFSSLIGYPTATLQGAVAAAKTRGERFFCKTRFMRSALGLLALAHGQASQSNSHCAWWQRGGPMGPRGCNNGNLGDVDEPLVTYVGDENQEHAGSALTGSACRPDMVSHNGQLSGVMDLAGPLWEIELGLTSDGLDWYVLTPNCDVTALQRGHTDAADFLGKSALKVHYFRMGPRLGALTEKGVTTRMGSPEAVLSSSEQVIETVCAGLGVPLLHGVGGHTSFGHDGLWARHLADAVVLSGGHWASGRAAGIWSLSITDSREASIVGAGFRSGFYL